MELLTHAREPLFLNKLGVSTVVIVTFPHCHHASICNSRFLGGKGMADGLIVWGRGLAFVEDLLCAATEQGTLEGHLMYFFSLDDLKVNW